MAALARAFSSAVAAVTASPADRIQVLHRALVLLFLGLDPHQLLAVAPEADDGVVEDLERLAVHLHLEDLLPLDDLEGENDGLARPEQLEHRLRRSRRPLGGGGPLVDAGG